MRSFKQFAGPIRGADCRYGFFTYNQHDSYIGKALELYGEYCEHELSLFKQLLQPSDVVWEIGANIGSQTVPISTLVSSGKVYAFEPQIEVFKLLCSNLAINNCENAIPLWLALGDVDGNIDIPLVDYNQPSSNFGSVSLLESEKLSGNKVAIRKIDSLTEFSPPNFLKIDVEGMELMVIKGGINSILKNRPLIFVENNGNDRWGPGTSENLIQKLWDLNYNLYWYNTFYYNQNNFCGNSTNIYGRKGSFNMICIPGESSIILENEEILDKNYHPLNQ